MPDPTITSKNLPPTARPSIHPTPSGPQIPEIVATIPYDQIEAKPLRSPNFINLLPTNTNMSLFWGNPAVGEKESGLRYDQLIAMGFVPAKPEDVLSSRGHPCPPSICRDGR